MQPRLAPALGLTVLSLAAATGIARAQGAAAPTQPAAPPAAASATPPPTPASATTPAPSEATKAPDKLVLLFGSGSDALAAASEAKLDEAGRLYRVGKPIVMVVTGSSDTTGAPGPNLLLSQRRADAVARGLEERGIPAERTQILAKGVTGLPVSTGPGVAEPQNRRVEITWR